MRYVVSDVHGHRDELVEALRSAGLLDAAGHWSGGDATLWVLGDYVDRGPDGVGVVDLVDAARSARHRGSGGRVGALMGNHEVLALGMHRFGDRHGPRRRRPRARLQHELGDERRPPRDQARLTPEHLAWLAALPARRPRRGLAAHPRRHHRVPPLGRVRAGGQRRGRRPSTAVGRPARVVGPVARAHHPLRLPGPGGRGRRRGAAGARSAASGSCTATASSRPSPASCRAGPRGRCGRPAAEPSPSTAAAMPAAPSLLVRLDEPGEPPALPDTMTACASSSPPTPSPAPSRPPRPPRRSPRAGGAPRRTTG